MFASLLSTVAGVSPVTLDEHEPESCWLVYALGIALLFVTFPLAVLGMAVYAASNFISPAWPLWQQNTLIGVAALVWGLVVVFGVDRTLLVLSDAIDPTNRWATLSMVALRFTIAIVLSSLVADEIILWRYRGPIAEAANAIAIDTRGATGSKLDSIHGITQKSQAANTPAATVDALRAERNVLPADVTAKLAIATRCTSERESLTQRYVGLRTQARTDETVAPALARLGQQLADKRRECVRLTSEASSARAAFLNEKDTAIAEAGTQLRQASSMLSQTQQTLDQEKQTTGAATTAAWQDGSSREAAFSRVKAERPDIKRNALLLWLALLLLELLPLLAKLFAVNNPVSASIRKRLQTEAAEERMQVAQSANFEAAWASTLASEAANQANVQRILAIQDASAPLAANDQLLTQADASRRRMQRAAKSANAGTNIHETTAAFLNAQAAAFERFAKNF